MRKLLDMGVDGIMTDRPEVLKAVLVERGVVVMKTCIWISYFTGTPRILRVRTCGVVNCSDSLLDSLNK